MLETALKAFHISNGIGFFKILRLDGYMIREIKNGKQGKDLGACDDYFNIECLEPTERQQEIIDLAFSLKEKYILVYLDRLSKKYGLTNDIKSNTNYLWMIFITPY